MVSNKRAVFWSGVEKVGSYLANFVIQIILARLLCPDDYAVIAMLAIFMSVAQVFIDGGFATVLIQKKDCSQQDFASVFYFNILVSVILYAVLFISAPYVESFYGFAGLAKVLRVYSIVLIINSFAMVNRLLVVKQLKFNVIAIINVCATVLSSIPTIYLASHGASYWALVIQSILNSSIITIGLWVYTKWKPGFDFSMKALHKLFPFGIRMFVVDMFYAFYNNLYSLLIGKKFPAVDLGYYDRGKYLGSMGPIGFSDFFLRAMYPIQSKIQDNPEKLQKSYVSSFRLISLIIVPLSIFISVFAKDILGLLYGEQWLGASGITSILCIGFMFYPLHALNVNMLKVKALGSAVLKSEILKKTISLILLFWLLRYDIQAVVIGWTTCAVLDFLISEYYYSRSFEYLPGKTLLVLLKLMALSLMLALSLKGLLSLLTWNSNVLLICSCLSYGLLYFTLMRKTIMETVLQLE
jgi:O-antigen/teichoic acid export membrane protein